MVDESSPRFAAELGWTEASTGGNSSENGRAKFAVHAMTDVTGFGMIGHAREMALASDVSLRIAAERIPLLEGALECIRAGYVPGGLNANREFAECCVAFENAVPDELRTIAFDPQTAGGLLVSVAPQDAERLTRALVQAGVPAVEIGDVVARTTPLITIY
ncbi:MAG TPA: AIR synthase-related protein [Terriglobales bacterium]|nr:AIR synthase-related protein [Terriglobales bacterium]